MEAVFFLNTRFYKINLQIKFKMKKRGCGLLSISFLTRDWLPKFATRLSIIIKSAFYLFFWQDWVTNNSNNSFQNFKRLCSLFWFATWTCTFKWSNILMTISWLISFCFILMRRIKWSLVLAFQFHFEDAPIIFNWSNLRCIGRIFKFVNKSNAISSQKVQIFLLGIFMIFFYKIVKRQKCKTIRFVS